MWPSARTVTPRWSSARQQRRSRPLLWWAIIAAGHIPPILQHQRRPSPHHPPPARKPTLQTKASRSQCVLCVEKTNAWNNLVSRSLVCLLPFPDPKGWEGHTHNLFGDMLPPRDVLRELPLNINHLLQRPRVMGGGGSLPGVRNR